MSNLSTVGSYIPRKIRFKEKLTGINIIFQENSEGIIKSNFSQSAYMLNHWFASDLAYNIITDNSVSLD